MKGIFDIAVVIVLLGILYGFYNILYSHENNKEDFLIYKSAENRRFVYL